MMFECILCQLARLTHPPDGLVYMFSCSSSPSIVRANHPSHPVVYCHETDQLHCNIFVRALSRESTSSPLYTVTMFQRERGRETHYSSLHA